MVETIVFSLCHILFPLLEMLFLLIFAWIYLIAFQGSDQR